MANTGEKKKKKGNIVRRMMFGNENKPDFTPEQSNMSKWAMFKFLFFNRFGTMVALNLLACIFAIPAVIVVILFTMNIRISDTLIPYSANLGIGYPVVINALAQGRMVTFSYQIIEFLILVPCIAIFALGVAGNLYVMRKLIWEEPTRTAKDFFRGIKKCWLPALVIGFVVGFTVLLFVFTLGYFDAYGLSVAAKAVSIVFASLLLVAITLFTAFFMTQNAAFKMKPMVLIRNSFLFVLGTNVQGILFIAIGLAPIALWFIPSMTMIVAMVYVFLGVSFSTLVISLYCHYCYQRFLYDKIEGKTAVYSKRPNDIHEQKEQDAKKKQAPVPYKNPKKRKKSIDEGASLTPLTPTFRREDLERLEKEHEQILTESDDDDIDIDADLGELDDEPTTLDANVEAVEATENVENTVEQAESVDKENT